MVALAQALKPSASVDYVTRADIYHGYRLWTGAVSAAVLMVVEVTFGAPVGLWWAAFTSAVVAVHAGIRLGHPRRSALDGILVDTGMILAFTAIMRPAVGVMGVAVLYVGIPAVLFLSARQAGAVVGFAYLGMAAVRWGFPNTNPSWEEFGLTAILLAAAAMPTVMWLLGTLVETITLGRHAVMDLDESVSRFERLFHRSVVPSFRSTLDAQLLDANPAFVELFAAPGIEALRNERLTRLYSAITDRVRLLDQLVDKGSVRGMQIPMRRWDGTVFWARLSARLVETRTGRFVEGIVEDVTAEEDLRRDRATAQVALSEVASAVVVADSAGVVVEWNPAAEELFGIPRQDAIGRASRSLIVGTDDELDARGAKTLSDVGKWAGEAEIIRADGSIRQVSVSINLIDHSGTLRVATVFTDLTDAHVFRRRLALKNDLLAQVHNGVVVTDVDGNVTFWNKAAERMYGWSGAEAVGTSILELTVPTQGREAATQVLAEVAAKGLWQGELEVMRKDGSTFPALVTGTTLYNDAGVGIGAVGVSSDITHEKLAEAQARAQGELAAAVLASVHFPVAVIDSDGWIVSVNDEWTRFTELNGGDPRTCGVGANYLQVCDRAAPEEQDAQATAAGLRRILEGSGTSFSLDYSCHAPGDERWFRLEAVRVPAIGAVVVHWNVTAERHVQRTLEDSVATKDEFLSAVAHQLRTPLTAVVGFSEHLRNQKEDPVEAGQMIDLIADQARAVADILEDLLLVGRLNSHTITVQPEHIDIGELIEGVTRPWRHNGHPEFDIDVTGEVGAFADPLRTRQILRNLISNALQHGMPPVRISASHVDGNVRIDVIDHGAGAPRYAESGLFEPYTHRSSDGQPGTMGLGLHVGQRLARHMNGELTYRRQDPVTIFSLTLPRRP